VFFFTAFMPTLSPSPFPSSVCTTDSVPGVVAERRVYGVDGNRI